MTNSSKWISNSKSWWLLIKCCDLRIEQYKEQNVYKLQAMDKTYKQQVSTKPRSIYVWYFMKFQIQLLMLYIHLKHLQIMGRVHFIQLCCNVLFDNIHHVWGDNGLIFPPIFHKAIHYFNNGIRSSCSLVCQPKGILLNV